MRVQQFSILAATLIALGSTAAVAGQASNAETPVKPAATAPAKTAKQEKLICKAPRSTGTWTAEKVCRTKAEWKKHADSQYQ